MKNDILKCIMEALGLLEEIPVKDTGDCWKKVQMHDKLALAYKAVEAIKEQEETDEHEEADDHEG